MSPFAISFGGVVMKFNDDSLERRLYFKLLYAQSVDEKTEIYSRLQQLSIVDVPLHERWVAANVFTNYASLGQLAEEDITERKWRELSIAERMYLVLRFHGLFLNSGAVSVYQSELANVAPEISEFMELISAVEMSTCLKSCNAAFGGDFLRSRRERKAALGERRGLCETLDDYEQRYFEIEHRSPLSEYLNSWVLDLSASGGVGALPQRDRGLGGPSVSSLRIFSVETDDSCDENEGPPGEK
jgi:hypothetical protein